MQDILSQIKQAFTAAGGKNIYTAFDAVPIRDKGEFFTVLSIDGYEAMPPIYTNNKIYVIETCFRRIIGISRIYILCKCF